MKIYSDGSASIDLVIEPDPTLARLNVSLMGEIYERARFPKRYASIPVYDLVG